MEGWYVVLRRSKDVDGTMKDCFVGKASRVRSEAVCPDPVPSFVRAKNLLVIFPGVYDCLLYVPCERSNDFFI